MIDTKISIIVFKCYHNLVILKLNDYSIPVIMLQKKLSMKYLNCSISIYNL